MNPPQTIRADLAHQRARRRGGWLRVLFGIVLVLLLGGGLLAAWAWQVAFAELPPIPDKAALWSLNRPPGVTFLDRSGQVIGIRGPRHGEAVSVRTLPPFVVRAFLAAEDRRFYSHHGIDLQGIARALHADVGAGRVVQGGSTITQQIAKNLFLSPSQTLKRKLQEAALAWKIERLMSKDEVLELYLNRIYFGAGAYGVDAAAEVYFGKPARALSLPEAALLAALPKAPSRLALVDNLAAARARSRLVLAAMRQEGWISPDQEHRAVMAPLALAPERPAEGDFGYVFDLAAARARQLTAGKVPDLVVRLTIDPALQHEAAEAIRSAVRRGRRVGATQGALVALDQDGAVRALVGGVDHRDSPFDRATQARRQPGSSFKPFVYAAALEAGVKPYDFREDAPIRIGNWTPENYGGGYSGPVTVADALARSINTVAVRLGREAGPDRVAALARRFGLGMIPPHPAPPIALGAYEVDLLDLVSAFQVFQQGGHRVEPFLIASIHDARGDLLWRQPPSGRAGVYDPQLNGQMIRMMEAVILHGTGTRANFGRPAAGKTGTSQNWRDAWFVGFTPDWVAGVWLGDDAGRPMGRVAGGELPAETWRRFMTAAHKGLPVRDFENLPSIEGPGRLPPSEIAAGETEPAAPPGDEEAQSDQGPSGPPPPRDDSRSGFYDSLADDLGRAARGRGPP